MPSEYKQKSEARNNDEFAYRYVIRLHFRVGRDN